MRFPKRFICNKAFKKRLLNLFRMVLSINIAFLQTQKLVTGLEKLASESPEYRQIFYATAVSPVQFELLAKQCFALRVGLS